MFCFVIVDSCLAFQVAFGTPGLVSVVVLGVAFVVVLTVVIAI